MNWQAYEPYIEVSVEGQKMGPDQPISSNLYSMVAHTVTDGAITPAKVAPGYGLVPSGAILMFAGACPSGWTRFTALDNAFPLGAASYGTTGGSATNTHTHPIASDGSHGHQLGSVAQYSGGGCGGVYNVGWQGSPSGSGALFPFCPGAGSTTYQAASSATNGAAAHNHGGDTGNSSIAIMPPYLTVIWCQKN